MKKYEVNFYFGMYQPNPFVKPSKVVEVTVSEEQSNDEIISKALSALDEAYPRTYSATVSEIK